MDFAIRREGSVRIGLHRRGGDVIDLAECPILDPALFRLVPALRPLLARLEGLRRRADVQINLLDDGPDVLLATDGALSSGDRVRLASWAEANVVLRVSWRRAGDAASPSEPAASLRPATIRLSGVTTPVAPGAFLQASREGEAAIVDAVLAALPVRGRGPIIELFAGAGTISQAIAARGRTVHAYESDPAAIQSLRRAGNGRVVAVQRDLARQPLSTAELAGVAAVVLDPPYAGAAAQMPALAASGVPVVYVSCNPGALARDAQPLLAAGYRPMRAVAIDQFLWSAQVEAVVAFSRQDRGG